MKKKLLFTIPALALALAFPLLACDTDGGNTPNGANNGSPEDKNPPKPEISESINYITDWESKGIFAANMPEYEFDFTVNDANFSYEIGSEENELIFSRILSGEEDYRDHFGWFAQNPDYIYRFCEECYKAAGEIIKQGAFTQELRDKYYGLYTTNATFPYFSAPGITTESYQIYFKDDYSIKSISKTVRYNIKCDEYERWHYSLKGYSLGQAEKIDGELQQYEEIIYPYYEGRNLKGYKMTDASLLLYADMGDGKTADCSVDVSYYDYVVTDLEDEKLTYLSKCMVMVDFNNVYSGGIAMFDGILIFAEQSGSWDLLKVWEDYREEALTPIPADTKPTNKKYKLTK